jgi:DNA-binding transcriptional LysR family regulator
MRGIGNADQLTLRHLRFVAAIGDSGSLVGAAAILNVTQPTVSKALAELEAIVGTRLFERTRHGVRPTLYGTALLRHAKLLMSQLRHAAEELADLADGTGGRVVVGTLLAASARLLPDAVARLRRDRPRLSIQIIEGTHDVLLAALRSGDVDLVVGRLPEHGEGRGLSHSVLIEEGACIVVRAQHRIARKKRPRLADLVDFDWILPRAETTLRQQVDKDLAAAGIPVLGSVIASVSFLTNRQLLLSDDYVTVWPRQVALEHLGRREVVILPIELPSTYGPIGVSTRTDAILSPSSEALIAALHLAARRFAEEGRRERRP